MLSTHVLLRGFADSGPAPISRYPHASIASFHPCQSLAVSDYSDSPDGKLQR